MTKGEERELQQIESRFQGRIEQLANLRLKRLSEWFATNFYSRWTLKIIFGNGSELVQINDAPIWLDGDSDGLPAIGYSNEWCKRHRTHPTSMLGNRRGHVRCLQPINEAIDDVCEITNGYRRGCPDDISVQGARE